MAEYIYTIDDFSMTTTWNRQRVGTSQGENITTSGLTAAYATKSFTITGISLAEGENIKSMMLSAELSRTGTTDYSESITANGLSFNSGARKLDATEVVLDASYDVSFYFRASGNTPAIPTEYGTTAYSCTLHLKNVTLTITTGTDRAFDGEISSLNEGDKIIIEESADNTALYTLVHHDYNTGKALIFRDAVYGSSQYRNSETYEGYNGSALDTYLTDTFYAALPSTTTQFLQTIDYLITESANSGTSITINRTAATISGVETGLGGTVGYGSVLNYTDTVENGENYWTREQTAGMNDYAKAIDTSVPKSLVNRSVTSIRGVRPTLGVLEEQLVKYSETDEAYVFCTKCIAPGTLYINGSAANATELKSEANIVLSWSNGTAGYNAPISGYAVWYSDSENGTYELYGTTTETSMTVIGPEKSNQTYYFKVQTLGPEDADYCDSDLSAYLSAATRASNVFYYDGTSWILATVKYYNGSKIL